MLDQMHLANLEFVRNSNLESTFWIWNSKFEFQKINVKFAVQTIKTFDSKDF